MSDTGKMPRSVLRYRSVLPSSTMDVTTDEYEIATPVVTSQHRTITRQSSPVYAPPVARPNRKSRQTVDDEQIKRAKELEREMSRRRALRLLTGIIAGAVGGGAIIEKAVAAWDEASETYEEGKSSFIMLPLVCGHGHDSKKSPTVIKAYRQGDFIVIEENPAGDVLKLHLSKSWALSSYYAPEELRHIYLEIFAEPIDDENHYQVRVRITPTAKWFQAPRVTEILMLDKGQYFDTVNPRVVSPSK